MFPQYQANISEIESETKKRGKTLAFDFEKGDFVTLDGKLQPLEGLDGLKVWIEKCIRTVSHKNLIYDQTKEAYGVNTFNLTDRRYPKEFLYAEIQREITEALLLNPAITDVGDFTFEQANRTLVVGFTVDSIYGEQEVDHKWLTA